MINNSLPPKSWFSVAFEILEQASNRTSIEDFKQKAKLNTYKIGESYSYRMDVLGRLIRDKVIRVVDNRLSLGTLKNLNWLGDALEDGYQSAWLLVDKISNNTDEQMTFDQDALKRIGDKGEEFVLEQLRIKLHPSLHNDIEHIARVNDMAGFDISTPSVVESELRFKLEVKTSTRIIKNAFEFYISRNEYEVGKKDKNWCIVCVGHYNSSSVLLGHIYSYQIESRIPRDVDMSARWMSCKIRLENSILRPGLP